MSEQERKNIDLKTSLKKHIRPLWLLVFVLVILLLSLFVTFRYMGVSVADIFGPADLFAEVLGVLIVVVVVDQLMKRDRDHADKKFRYVAYKKIAKPIGDTLQLFENMTKASLPTTYDPNDLPAEYAEFVKNKKLWSNIRFIDTEKGAPILPKRTWRNHISITVKEVQEEIDSLIDRYLPFFDGISIELLEKVRGNAQLQMFRYLATLSQVDKEIGVKGRENVLMLYSEDGLEDLFRDMIALSDLIRKNTDSEIDLMKRRLGWSASKMGESRLSDEFIQRMGQKA